MALAVAVMIYALARHRFGAPAWLATLATVPVLYDGFEIQLEHLIMADVPFLFLLTLAVTLLLWDPQPSLRRCALVGLLLGLRRSLRSVGLPLLAMFAVYMIIRRISWRRVAATIVVCLLPVFGYAGWFDVAARPVRDDRQHRRVPLLAGDDVRRLPQDEPAGQRAVAVHPVPPASGRSRSPTSGPAESPLNRLPPQKFSPVPNQMAENFAIRAIEAQPLDYARAVFDDTWRVFAWKRAVFPNAATYDEYLFGYRPLPIPSWDQAHLGRYDSYAAAYVHGSPLTQIVDPFAAIIRGYQRYVWLPGTVYGLILLAGLGGMVLAWRRVGGEALLPWTISLTLIFIPAATAEFDYRYVLVAVPFACLAVAMAFSPGTAGRNRARRLGPLAGHGSGGGGPGGLLASSRPRTGVGSGGRRRPRPA